MLDMLLVARKVQSYTRNVNYELFRDDWYHQINIVAIADEIPAGKYPRVIKRTGKSPPQYVEL